MKASRVFQSVTSATIDNRLMRILFCESLDANSVCVRAAATKRKRVSFALCEAIRKNKFITEVDLLPRRIKYNVYWPHQFVCYSRSDTLAKDFKTFVDYLKIYAKETRYTRNQKRICTFQSDSSSHSVCENDNSKVFGASALVSVCWYCFVFIYRKFRSQRRWDKQLRQSL